MLVLVAAVVWEAMLGHHAIPPGLHAVELTIYVAYLGGCVLAMAIVADRRPHPRRA